MKAYYLGIEYAHQDVVQRVFQLDPPLEGHEHVVVSAKSMESMKEFTTSLAETMSLELLPETYIFASDAAGKILDWGELPGSYRGGTSHAQALANAGYEIVSYEGP